MSVRLPVVILCLAMVAVALWWAVSVLVFKGTVVEAAGCLYPCAATVFGLPFVALYLWLKG